MKMKTSQMAALATCAFLVLALGVFSVPAYALSIGTADITAIPSVTGSGNGTLDLRLFTFSGGEIPNASGLFNGDNGNNTLPSGTGADAASFAESYVTTGGDLKAYYNLNFAPGTITEMVLFLDLNETGGGAPNNTLGLLDIILNPTTINGSPNPAGDVTSVRQAAINQIYTGGSLIAWLDPEPAANLPVISQGAGWADYAIFTHINPFSLNDSDVLLFNISMARLSPGTEEYFLSGTYSGDDINPPTEILVPEPATLSLLGLAGLGFLFRRKRKA
jgi:hypothetical protein